MKPKTQRIYKIYSCPFCSETSHYLKTMRDHIKHSHYFEILKPANKDVWVAFSSKKKIRLSELLPYSDDEIKVSQDNNKR